MPIGIVLGLGQALHKGDVLAAGVFHVDGEHIAIPHGGQGNEALRALRQGGNGVDGVVQRVLEQGIQVQFLHEGKIRSSQGAGEHDATLLADADFFGQQHVQHLVARIGGALVGGDGLLELIQLLLGHRAPEGFDQVL